MKYNQADYNVLVTLFGKEKADKMSGALSNEDGELSLDLRINGKVTTEAEETLLKETAIQQGKEIGFKEVAKGMGVELASGEKDPVIIAEKALKTVTDSLEEKYKNPKPGEVEIELQGKLKDATQKYDTLFETHNKTLDTVKDKEKAFTGLQNEIKVKERNNTILKLFPEKMGMDRNDALLITTNTFEFDELDGKKVIKKGGEIIRNGAGEPEAYENVIKSFVEEKKWIKSNGMGGGDRGAGGTKTGLTPEQAEKAIIESGKDPGSTEGIIMFNEMTKTTQT